MSLLKKTGVGLELDALEARVVELSGSYDSPVLTAMGRISLPEGAVKDGMVMEPSIVGTRLKELWEQQGIRNKEVVIGVANQNVLVRKATFPKVPLDKLRNLIKMQAQDFLPMPLSSVELDYMITGERKIGDNDMLEVLLVVARLDMLENFLETVSIAGLEPKDMDVSSLALLRVIPVEDMSKTVAMINITKEMGNLLIAEKGEARLARLIPASLLEAEKASETDSSSLEKWYKTITAEIKSSIGYYQEQSASAVEKINISGCGSMVEGLINWISENNSIPVSQLQPVNGIRVNSAQKEKITRQGPEFDVCISLALRVLGE